jgi:DNA-binding Xre family transcriptional regulator
MHWRLREIAEPERWNAKKLAEATGLAYNTVWGIWTNRSKRADLDTLATLARVLKVRPGDLISDLDPEDLAEKSEAAA